MFSRVQTWSTLVGTALLALGAVGCGAYEPEPEVPQYQYAEPAPRPMTAEELAAYQAAHPEEGQDVAIGEDDAQADEYSDTDPSALTEFKPALDGHGAWVDDSTYGTVWKPAESEVGADFQPYVSAGHWTYADDTDYVWVSDYSWGWAPFHYGRWVTLPGQGWVWIPGRRYAGAWVTWRSSPGYGYVGWAPAPPDYYWYNGYATGWSFGFYHHYDHYAYCHNDHFFYGGGGGVRTYVVTGPAASVHYNRTVEYAPPARVAANPSVNGNGRVAARPSVGRQGPRPDQLGMGKDTIVAPPSGNQGLDRARTYAMPSTATAAGARPPIRTASANVRGPATAGSIPAARSQPSFRSTSPSVAANPQPSQSRPSFGNPSSNQINPSGNGGSRVSAAPRPSAPSQPSFRPSSPSTQTIRPSASPSQPSRPSVSSQPSFRPSAPSVQSRSAPAFRPSAPSGSSISRPSVSSGGGGGSRPSMGSSRPASPSVSRPSSSGGGSRSSGGGVRRR